MNEVRNLDSHYSSVSKVERTNRVAAAPGTLPSVHLFNNSDADRKMQAINNDIYEGAKREKKRSLNTFFKCMGAVLLLFLGLKFFKKL